MPYYLSLQYSAIQKTVLRHNRLWSMAGISQGLAMLNEIEFVHIVEEYKTEGDFVLVAGGGKFTACFTCPERATSARKEIIRLCSTSFPMLEFQASEIVFAENFAAAKEAGILDQVNEQKRLFRGYATSYLPHLAVCDECGEYPAEKDNTLGETTKKEKLVCRTCQKGWESARIVFKELNSKKKPTTLELIYCGFLVNVQAAAHKDPVLDFAVLFPDKQGGNGTGKKPRMAVWLSDLNNMNQKVPIWLSQPEDKILNTFTTVTEANIAVVVAALTATFKDHLSDRTYLPFRLVIAGGDDLCLVMPEDFILSFAANLSLAVGEKIKELNKDTNNPLNRAWLQNHARVDEDGNKPPIGPYSFGGSFIITSTHTPFQRIHDIGEKLMKDAKEESRRQGDSVNWRVMAEEDAVCEDLFPFERPLAMTAENIFPEKLTFSDYLKLRTKYSKISSSHRFAILDRIKRYKDDPVKLERELKKYDSSEAGKSFSGLLTEKMLRRGGVINGELIPARIVTLFELLGIKGGVS